MAFLLQLFLTVKLKLKILEIVELFHFFVVFLMGLGFNDQD